MSTAYPDDIDAFVLLEGGDDPDSHSGLHAQISDAVVAIETELGTNPSSGYGTVAAALANLGGTMVATDHARVDRTAGDLTYSSTTWGALTATALDLTLGSADVPVEVGNLIEIGLSGYSPFDSSIMYLDVATIVGSNPVHYVSGLTLDSNSKTGVQAWRCGPSANLGVNIGGIIPYTVQSGDISSGTVKLRPYAVLGSGSGRTLYANTNAPLTHFARVIR